MFTYRSKCQFIMLLYVDGNVIEIRPGEKFISSHPINLRFLELENPIDLPSLEVKKPTKNNKYDSSSL